VPKDEARDAARMRMHVLDELKDIGHGAVKALNIPAIALALAVALVVESVHNEARFSERSSHEVMASAVLAEPVDEVDGSPRRGLRLPRSVEDPEPAHFAAKEAVGKDAVVPWVARCRSARMGRPRKVREFAQQNRGNDKNEAHEKDASITEHRKRHRKHPDSRRLLEQSSMRGQRRYSRCNDAGWFGFCLAEVQDLAEDLAELALRESLSFLYGQ
jgi:hypothetical protein